MQFKLKHADLLYDPSCRWRFVRPAPEHGGVFKEMEYAQTGLPAPPHQSVAVRPIEYFAVWGQERGLHSDAVRAAEVLMEAFAASTKATWQADARQIIQELLVWYFARQSVRWAFAFATAAKPTITALARLRQGDVRNVQVTPKTVTTQGRLPRTLNLGGGLAPLPIADSHLRFQTLAPTAPSDLAFVRIEQRREFFTANGGKRTHFEQLLLPVHLDRDRPAAERGQVPGLDGAFDPVRRVIDLPAVYLGVLAAATPAATRIDDFFVQDIFCHLPLDAAWMANLTWHGRSFRTFLQMNPVVCEMLVEQGVLVCE